MPKQRYCCDGECYQKPRPGTCPLMTGEQPPDLPPTRLPFAPGAIEHHLPPRRAPSWLRAFWRWLVG